MPYKRRGQYKSGRRAGARLTKDKVYQYLLKKGLVGPRGSATSKDMFGATYKTADPLQAMARRAIGFKGEGAYFGANPDVASGLRSGGEWLGSMTGIPGAGALGRWGAGQASKWLGFGEYTNQIADGASNMNIEVNPMNAEGDVYMSHTEYLGNVTVTGTNGSPSTFQQVVYELNPGLPSSFPFLSQIAQNFKLYDMQGLMFHYKPNSGEGSSNQLGKVVMCTQYDPAAPAYASTVEMQNYDYAQSSKPSLPMIHGVETAHRQAVVNMQYVRTGSTTRDKTLTDVGRFVIATEGIPMTGSSMIIGELWVAYRVKLSRACLNLGQGLLAYSATCPTTTSNFGPAAAPTANPNNTLAIEWQGINANSFLLRFPQDVTQGRFLIQVYNVTAETVNYFSTATATNGTIVSTLPQPSAVSTVSRGRLGLDVIVTVNAPDRTQCVVTIGGSGTFAAGTATLIVHQINPLVFA